MLKIDWLISDSLMSVYVKYLSEQILSMGKTVLEKSNVLSYTDQEERKRDNCLMLTTYMINMMEIVNNIVLVMLSSFDLKRQNLKVL